MTRTALVQPPTPTIDRQTITGHALVRPTRQPSAENTDLPTLACNHWAVDDSTLGRRCTTAWLAQHQGAQLMGLKSP